MRDPLTTRKLLAKIDRNIDVYVVLDRMRAAIYELDDDLGRMDKRITLLEDAERRRVTDTGVHRIVDAEFNTRSAERMKFAERALWTTAGGAVLSGLAWVASKIFHVR